jgi:hypothetical protein
MTTPALDADEALLGNANTLGIYVAPFGTTAPAANTLETEWETLGYVHEDGITITPEKETEGLMAWQSGTPIKNVLTSFTITIEATLLQHNAQTLALYWGQPVPTATGDTVTLNVDTNQSGVEQALIVDTRDGDKIARYYFPRAQVSEVGDLEIVRGAFQGLPVTFTALDPGTGIPAIIYLLDATTVTP